MVCLLAVYGVSALTLGVVATRCRPRATWPDLDHGETSQNDRTTDPIHRSGAFAKHKPGYAHPTTGISRAKGVTVEAG